MNNVNNVVTRQSQIEAMGLGNLPEMAQDLVLSQPDNVLARVESRKEHVRACLEQVESKLGNGDKAYSILYLVCELIGTGGHQGLGRQWGGETTRLSHFESCGTGRRHAGDGGAWDAAISSVLHDEVAAYADEEGSVNGKLVIHWDDQWKEVELVTRYHSTDEVCVVEQLFSHDPDWEPDTVPSLMELDLARSMRALLGQLLVALTRDQRFLALTHNDTIDGFAWNGIVIDRDSFKAPGALESVGLGFEYWSNKL